MERFIYAQIKILVDPYYYRACHITYLKISQTITYGWFYFNKLILSLSSRILFLNSRSSMLLFFSRRSDYDSIWCVKNGMETHTALGNLLVQICMIWKLLVALSRLSESELEQSTANSAVPCQKDIQLIKCKPRSKNNEKEFILKSINSVLPTTCSSLIEEIFDMHCHLQLSMLCVFNDLRMVWRLSFLLVHFNISI